MSEWYGYDTNTANDIVDGLLTRMDMFSGEPIWLQYDPLERLTLRNINGKVIQRYTYDTAESITSAGQHSILDGA